jgi:hypothetical protein
MTYQTVEYPYGAFSPTSTPMTPPAWASVMSYPHVRVCAGTGSDAYYKIPDECAANGLKSLSLSITAMNRMTMEMAARQCPRTRHISVGMAVRVSIRRYV